MRHLSIFIVLLLMATPAIASNTTGEITLGGQFVSGNNTDDSAQFLKYRDIDDQVISSIKVSSNQGGFFLTGSAENIGYDDQEYALSGNLFGEGKFSLWYDELTHNYSLDDKILHNGEGTGNLVYSGVDESDASTWLSHDFKVDRSQVGASFELTLDSPFFVAGEVTRTEKDGTYPIAVQNSGRQPMEVPAPIDYTTENFLIKAGYQTQKFSAQVDVMFSEFDNGEDLLEWEPTPVAGSAPPGTTYTLAPDNDSVQIGGQLIIRELPINSVLALRGSYAENESDPTLPALAGGISWDGEQSYTNFDAKLKSRPTSQLTTNISYHYTEKDNDADSFDYPDAGDDPGEAVTHVFSYEKYGIDLDGTYRFNSDNRLKAGYGFENVERPEMRHDAEETDTHTIFLEWKNDSLDWATSKLYYQHLMRESDFEGDHFADMFGPQASEEIARYIRPFDAADKDEDTIRWQFDMTPSDMIDLGFELAYSKSDYDETVIGRTDEKEHSIILDASIAMPMSSQLYAYVGYEKRELDSTYVRYRNNAAGNIDGGVPIPSIDESGERYNWDLEREDVGTSFGVKYDVPLLRERLKLSAAYDYMDNDGEADFSSAYQAANDTPLEDIKAYDDYTFQTVKLSGEYAIREDLILTLGYIYEKFEQDDIAIDGYVNVFDGEEYFSGAYDDFDYEANIGYATLTYKF